MDGHKLHAGAECIAGRLPRRRCCEPREGSKEAGSRKRKIPFNKLEKAYQYFVRADGQASALSHSLGAPRGQ